MSSPARLQGTVVLVNPNRMKPPVAPLALDYLASALAQAGFQVEVLDLCFSEDAERDIRDFFQSKDVLAVAFTIRNTDDAYFASRDNFIPQFKDNIDLIRRHTDAPVILGGAGFSVMPEAILRYCGLDFGVWGEGEHALPVLVERMSGGMDYEDVPGLVYRHGSELQANSPAFLDLASIPAPARDAIDNRRYFVEGGMGCIETKRGCDRGCIYCADPVGKGRQIRLRSPDSVADEIETLLGMGIDHLHLCDSEFNVPREHAVGVCEALVRRGLGEKVRWYTYASPGGFDREVAWLCRQAGCAGINFGVDSGCARMLRGLGRDFTVADVQRAAEACREAGITTMYDLLLGGPGETRESLRETIETVKRISPDRIGISLGVRIYPGTRLASQVKGQGPLGDNPNLHGAVSGNDGFVEPAFYLSAELGEDAPDYVAELIGGDERFFFASPSEVEQNYNYNENTVLVNAIREGYRGAFWDILRRLHEAKG